MDTTQKIVCDGHLHLYDEYRLPDALLGLFRRLQTLAGTSSATPPCLIGLLTESAWCNHYRRLAADPAVLPGGSGVAVRAGPEEGALTVLHKGQTLGFLVAGRQIVTRERLELLALTRDTAIPDGLPAKQALEEIRAQDAVPVIAWAAGKWLGARGQVVRHLIDSSAPDRCLLGDSGMRPALWPTPSLLRLAAQRGFRIVAGSDPLPFAGEEEIAGTFGFTCVAPFDSARPVASMRRLLADSACRLELLGRRTTVLNFARRWLANRAASKRRRAGAEQAAGR